MRKLILSDDQINLNKVIKISLDDLTDAPLDCLESLVDYAKYIAANNPGPYTLFVSGGVDSQAMLYAWKLSNIPFSAVHVKYNGFNDHDVAECIEFCMNEHIDLSFLNFDVLHFLEHDLPNYAVTYRCASPQICTHMAFSELVPDGTKLFSGNLAMPVRLSIDNTIYGLQRFATIAKKNIIPFFLLESLAVTQASILMTQQYSGTNMEPYEFKCLVYEAIGVPIVRQTTKLTGFELIKNYFDQFKTRVSVIDKLRFGSLPSKRVFDQLFRNKYLIEFKNHFSPAFFITRM